MERLRNVVALVILYFLWSEIGRKTGRFAMFTLDELVTYIVVGHAAKAFVFGTQSRKIAMDINSGLFSSYVLKPMNVLSYCYFQELAVRFVNVISAIVEIAVFVAITGAHVLFPDSGFLTLAFLGSLLLAHFLYFILSFAVSMVAFWSREAMGPRFLYEWILEFSSGAYFPLNILSQGFFIAAAFTPFFYMLFVPLMTYLGKLSPEALAISFMIQFLWLFFSGILTWQIYSRGLKRYTGEGM